MKAFTAEEIESIKNFTIAFLRRDMELQDRRPSNRRLYRKKLVGAWYMLLAATFMAAAWYSRGD